jgi:ABC-type Fe3+/spermidine/putrescine transport system ATPase subunit
MGLPSNTHTMPDQSIAIGFEKVSKVFGEHYRALDQVDLSVGTARFVSVVGPSG